MVRVIRRPAVVESVNYRLHEALIRHASRLSSRRGLEAPFPPVEPPHNPWCWRGFSGPHRQMGRLLGFPRALRKILALGPHIARCLGALFSFGQAVFLAGLTLAVLVAP